MANLKMYEDFFDIEEIKAEEDELTLQELQELVRDLSKRVAKLECHHAKF